MNVIRFQGKSGSSMPYDMMGALVSNRQHLIPALEHLNTAVVACVGDLMLDRFVYGDAQRISPEAPIPVLSIHRSSLC